MLSLYLVLIICDRISWLCCKINYVVDSLRCIKCGQLQTVRRLLSIITNTRKGAVYFLTVCGMSFFGLSALGSQSVLHCALELDRIIVCSSRNVRLLPHQNKYGCSARTSPPLTLLLLSPWPRRYPDVNALFEGR